jgi:hypothetical protein
MPALAVWMVSLTGSPWGVVALCVVWNLLSLIMILTAPETRGINLNQADSVRMIAGEAAAWSVVRGVFRISSLSCCCRYWRRW